MIYEQGLTNFDFRSEGVDESTLPSLKRLFEKLNPRILNLHRNHYSCLYNDEACGTV